MRRCVTSPSRAYSQLQGATSGPDQVLPASDHRCWRPDGSVKLRLGPGSPAPVSIPTMFRRTVDRAPGQPALWSRDPATGRDEVVSFEQYWDTVRCVARAWVSLGLAPHHGVSVLGHAAPRHHVANLATCHAGGFTAGMYLTNTAAACEYIARDSAANIIVVGDTAQLHKILSIRDNLPELRAVVLFEGDTDIPGVITWPQLLRIGIQYPYTVVTSH